MEEGSWLRDCCHLPWTAIVAQLFVVTVDVTVCVAAFSRGSAPGRRHRLRFLVGLAAPEDGRHEYGP